MNIFEAIEKRRSIRKYQPKPVDDKLIGIILWAATHAPTAGNMKEWKFIVVKDPKRKALLYEAALKQAHVKNAAVDIVVGVDVETARLKYGDRGSLVYALEDGAAAIENMLLAATALGLGSCWVGAMDEEAVRHAVGLPHYVRPIAIVTIGYPDETPEKKEIDYSRYCFEEVYGKRWEFEFKTLEEAIKEVISKFIALKKQK